MDHSSPDAAQTSQPVSTRARVARARPSSMLWRALLSASLVAASGTACQSLEFDPSDDDGGGGGGGVNRTPVSTSGAGEGGETPALDPQEAPIGGITAPVPVGDPDELFEQCAPPSPMSAVPLFESVHALPSMRSTASAAWAQAMLAAGRLPDGELLRSAEFLAHFASAHEGLEQRLEVDLSQADPSSDSVEISLRHFSPAEAREPLRLVVLVDLSASMQHALPVVRAVLGQLGAQLRESDEVGVVGFASETQVLAPLAPADSSVRTTVADLVVSTSQGADLAAGLTAAFALGDQAPVHVLLLSDGGFEPTHALHELVDARRQQGHRLSVLLTGKPLRDEAGGKNPLFFHRAAAELLSASGGGALLYAADTSQAERVLGGGGVGRALGVAGSSRGLRLALPGYFSLLLPEVQPAAFLDQSYAPGAVHSVRLLGRFCNPALLDGEGFAPYVATASLTLLDAAGEPTSIVNPLEKFDGELSVEERLERAVLGAYTALRKPGAPERRVEAVAALDSLAGELACGAADVRLTCRSLAELEAMLGSLASIVGG